MTQELSQTSLGALMLTSLIVGFVFGALYDIFRIRRIAVRKGKSDKKHLTSFLEAFIIGIEDILFFVALGSVTSVLFYVFSYGKVRLLSILCELIGFALYRLTLGRLVMLVSDLIISFLYFLWRKFVTCVIMPPINALKKLVNILFGKLYNARQRARRKAYSEKVKKKMIRASKGGMLRI